MKKLTTPHRDVQLPRRGVPSSAIQDFSPLSADVTVEYGAILQADDEPGSTRPRSRFDPSAWRERVRLPAARRASPAALPARWSLPWMPRTTFPVPNIACLTDWRGGLTVKDVARATGVTQI